VISQGSYFKSKLPIIIIVSWLDSPELEQKYTQYEKINEEKKEVLDQ
jgi:hypothetical protein